MKAAARQDQERFIVGCLLKGMSHKEIAHEFGLNLHAGHMRVWRLFAKLGCDNTSGFYTKAFASVIERLQDIASVNVTHKQLADLCDHDVLIAHLKAKVAAAKLPAA